MEKELDMIQQSFSNDFKHTPPHQKETSLGFLS